MGWSGLSRARSVLSQASCFSPRIGAGSEVLMIDAVARLSPASTVSVTRRPVSSQRWQALLRRRFFVSACFPPRLSFLDAAHKLGTSVGAEGSLDG